MSDDVRTREPLYISLTARPYRLGVFVPDLPGLSWETTFRGAIAATTRVWGGTQSLLVPAGKHAPVDGDHANAELFWELVRLADVDGWTSYVGSVGELKLLGSDEADHAAEQVDQAVAHWPAEDRDRERADLLEQLLVDVDVPAELRALLDAHAAPFGRKRGIGPWPLTGGRVGYPLTDALSVA